VTYVIAGLAKLSRYSLRRTDVDRGAAVCCAEPRHFGVIGSQKAAGPAVLHPRDQQSEHKSLENVSCYSLDANLEAVICFWLFKRIALLFKCIFGGCDLFLVI
jgi:hypothetical protein